MSPESRIDRRTILKSAAGSAAAIAFGIPHTAAFAAKQIGENRPQLAPVFQSTVCRWTPENPRHDHQLIFPLDRDRLLLVWCEYYVNRPSLIFRNQRSKSGQAGDHMPCRISAKVSSDRGRTWSGRIIMQENVWKQNVKHPNLIRLPSGEVLFSFVGWDSAGQRNVYMKRSRDHCETWSKRVQISEPGWYCNNNDHAVTLRSGRILIPAHGPTTGGAYLGGKSKLHSWVYYSDDGFRTWQRSKNNMTADGRGTHEPSIVELEGGRLLCLLRTTLGRVYQSLSEDQGETWSKTAPTVLPAPDSPPLIKRIPTSGDLLLLWNNIESRSNWPRTPLSSAISTDEGQTWEHFADVDNRPKHDAAYAAVTFLDDEALVTYYTRNTNWARDSEVMLKVFDIAQFYG